MAARVQTNDVLVIWQEGVPPELAVDCTSSPLLRQKSNVRLVRVTSFDPKEGSSWARIKDHLEGRFIWLPWNWVTNKQALACLPAVGMNSVDWRKPAHVAMDESPVSTIATVSNRRPEGIVVTSPGTVKMAEQFLVAHSGKVLDGVHSSFNRRLCRPLVRLLSHTSITPNAVTLGGVVVSIASAIAFARGSYWAYVAGAMFFFIAGLFDEMDGMLARIKFADSPFGTWFEGFADGLSYLLLFGGITLGLHRQHGRSPLITGAALLIGTLLALIVTSLGRKHATTPDKPNEYLGRFYQLLEKDSSNWISKAVRQVHAFQKRGVLIHYVVIFTVLGGLQLLFFLATLGSHLTWILSLYFNHRFFRMPARITGPAGVNTISEAV
jgi:phosphatidylglycerophosphate synthase